MSCAVGVVAGWDFMHVQVERHHHALNGDEVESRQARFLAGFAERHFFDVPLAIGVAAELQPAAQLAMVREQAAAAIGREDPGRRRDVPGPAGALETIGPAIHERADPIDNGRLTRKGVAVAGQHVKQRPAVHGRLRDAG